MLVDFKICDKSTVVSKVYYWPKDKKRSVEEIRDPRNKLAFQLIFS